MFGRVRTLCEADRDAIALFERRGVHTLSADEQTGIQALERIAADKPPRPGQVAKREYEYRRHGTRGLFENRPVASGRILSPLVRQTRTEEDFVENIGTLVLMDSTAGWRFVVGNLNTHASASLVRDVATACGIDDDLGKKGRCGILKSLPSRREFLGDPTHRLRVIRTPKHRSWLKQIEIWFGTLRSKLTRRGSVPSTTDRKERILSFIGDCNATRARPYNWTSTGRLLCVERTQSNKTATPFHPQ